ncbi:MAG: hypothetical protein GYB68_10620, partial [Chloroflexi bacterium]|nr:hypothetical protein [Chloroflexota bacterium]
MTYSPSYTTRAQAKAAYAERNRNRFLRVLVRDTLLLIREFRWILLAFFIMIGLATFSFFILWNASSAPDNGLSLTQTLFFIITMTFFEPTLDFQEVNAWYLQIYFFMMPLVGLIFLTLGVADFAVLLFNRRAREEQWEETVASTFSGHIIVVGLGHVGLRVVRELIILGEDIVVIEKDEIDDHFAEARSYDIPIIVADGRSEDSLRKAGIDKASGVIIATNNDLVNLEIASRIRENNPNIRLVMRMFDDDFAQVMAERFDISAVFSSSALAAPAFAGAATGTEIIQTFKVADTVLAMGRLEVQPGCRLDGATVREVETEVDVSVVFWQGANSAKIDVHPARDHLIRSGDTIAVVAGIPDIKRLASEWNRM